MTLVPPDIEGVSGGGARERIVRAAYDLFCRYGVAATGVERIIAEAGVHRTSLYNHFASKEHLALAVLERREEVWSRGWLARVASGGATPAEGLLALFDAFDEWFHRDDYEGCLLIGALLKSGGRTAPWGSRQPTPSSRSARFSRSWPRRWRAGPSGAGAPAPDPAERGDRPGGDRGAGRGPPSPAGRRGHPCAGFRPLTAQRERLLARDGLGALDLEQAALDLDAAGVAGEAAPSRRSRGGRG